MLTDRGLLMVAIGMITGLCVGYPLLRAFTSIVRERFGRDGESVVLAVLTIVCVVLGVLAFIN